MSLRTACVLPGHLLALGGAWLCGDCIPTAELFGWLYGAEKKESLLKGDIAPSGENMILGDVVYTLDDVIYKDGTVYGTGTMRPREGANIVLMTEDYGVNEPAGYLLHYGEEEIPEDAPSYAELAREKGAKIILSTCIANGVLNEDGTLNASEIGLALLPQRDGSIRFTFEFEGGGANTIDRAESYPPQPVHRNWEVTPEGLAEEGARGHLAENRLTGHRNR